MNNNSTINTVQLLVQKAKEAQKQIEKYNQEQVDEIVTAIAWALCNPTTNKLISNLAVETTGKGAKTVGVINEDKKKGIVEIAKPVGVVGAVTPSTNPAATPINNILNAVKGRNAIIISPSPAGQNVFKELLLHINKELDKIKAPTNLIQTFETKITKDLTNELMKHVDLVVVTGSQNNVREAAKSGTPAIGVGQGNVTVIVDESANLKEAANKIKMSKIFDNATSCSSENSIILVQKIYDEFINLMKLEGGVLLNNSEKKLLEKALWIKGKLNRNLIAKPAIKIATEIKLNLNSKDNVKFLMVEENGIGPQHLFSGEKLSPVLTVYKAEDFNHAKNVANEILNYQGIGHSIGIHTNKNERVMKLGLDLPVCRVIVNQAHAFATGGSFNNGLPFSLSMGCGTWQKNSIDNNLNYKHFINITKISTTIKGNEPKLKDFFEDYCRKYHKEEIKDLD